VEKLCGQICKSDGESDLQRQDYQGKGLGVIKQSLWDRIDNQQYMMVDPFHEH
jgi:hypothetical protein